MLRGERDVNKQMIEEKLAIIFVFECDVLIYCILNN